MADLTIDLSPALSPSPSSVLDAVLCSHCDRFPCTDAPYIPIKTPLETTAPSVRLALLETGDGPLTVTQGIKDLIACLVGFLLGMFFAIHFTL